MSDEREVRLVLRQVESQVHAFLYPADGGPFATPELVFPVAPEQELPRLEPGALVTLRGDGEEGEVRADGLVVRAHRRRGMGSRFLGNGQVLAEKGDVVAHPDVVGWEASWRHVRQTSSIDLPTWRRRLRRRIVAGCLALLVALVVVGIQLGTPGSGTVFLYFLLGGGSLVANVAAWTGAVRARHAVRAAEAASTVPAVAARMRLWWSAGDGLGPVARATLSGVALGEEALEVPVVGVPGGSTPEGHVDVRVHLRDDGPPVIRWGEHVLWPAGPVRRRPGATSGDGGS